MATLQQRQELQWREDQRGLMLGGIDSNEYELTQPHGLDALGYDHHVELEQHTGRAKEWHTARTQQRTQADTTRQTHSERLAQIVSENLAAAMAVPSSTPPSTVSHHRLVPSAGCVDCDTDNDSNQISEAHVWLSEHRRPLTQILAATLGVLALTLI